MDRWESSKSVLFFLILLSCLPLQTALAAPTEAKLLDSGGDADDNLGWSVALDDSYAIVGAPADETGGFGAGKAVIFHDDGSGWSEQASLFPTVSAVSSRFGTSVDISGNYAIVGAPYSGGGVGAGLAYVYERSGTSWSLHEVISGVGTSLDDNFGYSVALDGDRLMVGAPFLDHVQSNTGAVYAYERSGASWTYINRVHNPLGAAQWGFGSAVDIDFPWTVVSSFPRGGNLGWVYVLDLPAGSWAWYSNFRSLDYSFADHFGISLSISGDRVLVGAADHFHHPSLGSAYVFDPELTPGNWNQEQEFIEMSLSVADRMGSGVALQNGLAAVGSPRNGSGGVMDAGVTHVYRRANTPVWGDGRHPERQRCQPGSAFRLLGRDFQRLYSRGCARR